MLAPFCGYTAANDHSSSSDSVDQQYWTIAPAIYWCLRESGSHGIAIFTTTTEHRTNQRE